MGPRKQGRGELRMQGWQHGWHTPNRLPTVDEKQVVAETTCVHAAAHSSYVYAACRMLAWSRQRESGEAPLGRAQCALNWDLSMQDRFEEVTEACAQRTRVPQPTYTHKDTMMPGKRESQRHLDGDVHGSWHTFFVRRPQKEGKEWRWTVASELKH
mmetsp:Transcript_99246/g.206792  ORF Transcript_99246/g.206792 Transcript_99246/m.206792 type:complete len:156 (+) Transcript_99246:2-469(+)